MLWNGTTATDLDVCRRLLAGSFLTLGQGLMRSVSHGKDVQALSTLVLEESRHARVEPSQGGKVPESLSVLCICCWCNSVTKQSGNCGLC